MYGFICCDNEYDWWVRRKEKGKSDIVISREEFRMINGEKRPWSVRHHNLDYAISYYCECPYRVKKIARELKEKLNEIN